MKIWQNGEWRAVASAFGWNGLLFGAWASRVPYFKEGFDLAPGTLGLLLLALAGGAIASFPLAGYFVERCGARRLTIGMAFVYGPALCALALAPSPYWLGGLLFSFGASHGAMDVAMNAWGGRVEAQVERTTMPVFHAVFSLGAGLGAASGFVASSFGMGPILHFVLVASICGAATLFVMTAAEPQSPRTTAHAAPLWAMPSRSLFLVGVIAFSMSMGEGAMADWSAVFLRIVVDATEAQAALGYSVFSLMMVVTRLIGGMLIERFGAVWVTRGSATSAFAGVVLAISGASLQVVMGGFALMGIGYAVVMPLAFSRASRDPDLPPGLAIAGIAMFGYGGMLLGPPMIGFAAQMFDLRTSFGVLAILAALTLALARRLGDRH